MKRFIEWAAYVTLVNVAIGALVVALVAGEPEYKMRFWLALSILATGALAFIAGMCGAGIEAMNNSNQMAQAQADFENRLVIAQREFSQQMGLQFQAGFDYANGLHAGSVDSVARAWGVASKRLPQNVMPLQGTASFGRIAELAEGGQDAPLEL